MTATQDEELRGGPGATHTRGGGQAVRRLRDAVPFWAALTVSVGLLPWLANVPPLQAALSLLNAALAAAGIARAAYPVLRPVALVTFVFTFSWLGVAPIYQLSTGKAAWRDSAVLFGPHTTPALLLLLLATGTMYAGFFRREQTPRTRTDPEGRTRWLVPPRAVCLAYVLGCLALAPRAIGAAGGLAGLFSSRNERNQALAAQGISLVEAGGLEVALIGILPGALATAGAYLLLVRVLHQYRRSGWHQVDAADAVLLAIALALVVVFANPFTNTRGLSAAALGSLVILVLQPRSQRAGIVMAVAMLVATLVAYPAADAFRGTEQTTETRGLEFLASYDFDGFQQSINTVSYVDALGHSFGTYTMSGVLYFVPRATWPDKERPASIDVAERRGYAFTNLSLPIHAEMYLDFGPLGMALILFLLASLGRRCDLDWASGIGSRFALMAPYACLASLLIIRGPVGSVGPVYLTNFGLIAAGLLVARVLSTDPASSEAKK